MKLITEIQKKQLLANRDNPENARPVIKLFNPAGAGTWLISEWDGADELFGLADLGCGTPEMGYISLSELESIRLPFGLLIERDLHFKPNKSLVEYADEARQKGAIWA